MNREVWILDNDNVPVEYLGTEDDNVLISKERLGGLLALLLTCAGDYYFSENLDRGTLRKTADEFNIKLECNDEGFYEYVED